MNIYVVYLYCDYRKEVDIQHLKAFKSRDDAINFAKKYANPKQSEQEYTLIQGSEYDAQLFYPDEDSDDCETQTKQFEEIKKELKIKPGMWSIRIAVDQTTLE